MRFGFIAGDTSKTIYVRLRDSTTGLAKTGLAYNSAGAVASYTLPLAARAAITLATQTVTGAWSSGGFVEVDATNCPGLYRFDLPNAAIASGAFTIISITFTGVIQESIEVELDTQKANVTQLLGTAWLTPGTAGTPDVNVKLWNGLTTVALPLVPTTAGRTLDVSAGGEAGVDSDNIGGTGNFAANLKAILGTTLTETAGLLAAGFKKFFNVATPTGTVNSLPDAVPGAANGLFIAGTNAPVTITGSGDALTITSTGGNGQAVKLTSQGSGDVLSLTAGATGRGISITTTSGHGVQIAPGGTAKHGIWITAPLGASHAIYLQPGLTGNGILVEGGATSGDAIKATTTSGHAVNLAATGTDKHGLFVTGGTGGTSDGIKAVAGTGGVPIRGDLTGNITGNLSGSVGGNVTGSVGSVATGGIAAASFAAGAITAAALASDAATEIAAAVWDLSTTGHTTSGTFGEAMAAAGSAGDPWTTALPGSYTAGQAGKIVGDNLNATVSSRAVAGDAMALTSGERATLTAAVWASATRTLSSFGTLVADIWTSFNATQLAKFFSVASGTTYGSAVAQSVVKEIADNAGSGGGGATQKMIGGSCVGSGGTIRVEFYLLVDGQPALGAALSSASVTALTQNGTALTFTPSSTTIDASGLVRIYGTASPAPAANQHLTAEVTVTHAAAAQTGFCAGVALSSS